MTTRGVVYVHSAPPALCPHVEWAVGGVLGMRVTLDWTPQPAAPGTVRARAVVAGRRRAPAPGSPRALRDWMHLRFEVTEEPSAGAEGERWSSTPDAGPLPRHDRRARRHHGARGPAARRAGPGRRPTRRPACCSEMQGLLGKAWDDELEPFRYAGDGAPVRWLHQVV